MADISKIKLADGTQLNVKDATGRGLISAAQGSITAEIGRAQAAEATISANLTAEVTRATGVESGLNERITSLEARGRFLSSWSCKTGTPDTYPTVPTGATTYTYAYKSGDYYIVGNVEKDEQQKRWKPNGSSISTTDGGTTWTVGKVEETREVNENDYYVYDGTKWTLISNTQKTVTFQNISGDADDNANLKGKLDALRDGKLSVNATVAGVAFTGTTPNVSTTDLQNALGLEDLAYSDTASGTVNTIDSITMNSLTISGNAVVTSTITTATITTKEAYTPAGTVSTPTITITPGTEKTFATGLTGGSVASFTEGTFTPAEIKSGFYTAGTAATWTGATYTAPSLGTPTKSSFATKGIVATVNTDAKEGDPDFEVLTFSTAPTVNAVTDQGEFISGSVDFGNFNGGSVTVIDTTKFSGGSKAADTFTPNVLQSVNTDKVHDTPSASSSAPVFTGIETANLIPTVISYTKANGSASYSTTVTPTVATYTRTAKTVSVTPDPEV